jgi:hypothetical protein
MSTYIERRQDFLRHMRKMVKDTPSYWNMAHWYQSREGLCSAACALGSYVTHSKMAKEAGWTLDKGNQTSDEIERYSTPVIYGIRADDGAAEYFDISGMDANTIFVSGYGVPLYEVTPAMVLDVATKIFKEYASD